MTIDCMLTIAISFLPSSLTSATGGRQELILTQKNDLKQKKHTLPTLLPSNVFFFETIKSVHFNAFFFSVVSRG
jgi:hypothetical protein